MLIKIKNLSFDIIVGVNDWERSKRQPIVINIEMRYDGRQAAEFDNFVEAVDYDHVQQQVVKLLQSSRFYLIETLADRIADAVLSCSDKIDEVKVEVSKPMALAHCEAVSVEVRKRQF